MPNETGNNTPANGTEGGNSLGNKVKNVFSWLGGAIESGLNFAYELPGRAQEFAQQAGGRIRTGYTDFAGGARETARENPAFGLGGIDTKTLLIVGAMGLFIFMLSNKK